MAHPPASLAIYLLGPARLERNGQIVEVETRKALALLAYLALHPERLSRDQLATFFWPEYDQARAYANLRRTLWALNKALGEGWIMADNLTIELRQEAGLWIDVLAFQRLLAQCRDHDHRSDEVCAACLALLVAAVQLVRGNFLEGFSLDDSAAFDDWQFFEAESLRKALATSLEKLVRWHSRQQEDETAIGYARRWLALDPLHEPVQRWLMQLYAWSGQPAAAAHQYQECVRVLKAELDAEPEAKTTTLYQRIRTKQIGPRSAPPSTDEDQHAPTPGESPNKELQSMQRNHLIEEGPKLRFPLQRPPRAEHFVDRKADLAQLLADLQPGRVITLCGPGGIGKSALAAEAVWQLAPGNDPPERFPDGILFYSFYDQPQAVVALEHIAHSLGEEPKPTPKAAAQRALAGRRFLLILDGSEAADELSQVLDIRDQCGVLVTSRQRKDAVAARQDLTPLLSEDAITLVQAWGSVRATDKAAIAQISEIVGRLPLALRLVGRYLAQSEESAGEYLAWLAETPLTALDQGQRREQSIPLLLTRSLDQVSALARQVLGVVGLLALAPFAGDLIATALALSPSESQQALGALVNYGFLRRPVETYEMTHALIHTYARQRLSPATETVIRLATYYTTFVNQHKDQFERLNQIRPHVLALLESGGEHQAWAAVNSLAWAIEGYLDLQGYWTDRITAIEAGLAAAVALQDRQGEGAWLGCLGEVYAKLGQVKQALGYYQQALAIAQELGDRGNEGGWLGRLGEACADLGQVKQAMSYYQQALAIAQEIGNRAGESAWLGRLGMAYAGLGQLEQAIGYYQQALAIAQELGNRRQESIWLGCLGEACTDLGQYQQALAYHQQALAIDQEMGNRQGVGGDLYHLGYAYAQMGQYQQAIGYYQQAIEIDQELGDRWGEGEDLDHLGYAYAQMGQVKQALGYHQQALAIAQELGNRRGEGTALGHLGRTYAAQGQYQQALDYYQQALAIAQDIGDRYHEATWLANLGLAYRDLRQVVQAQQAWEQALSIFEEIKLPRADMVRQWLSSL